MKKVILYTLFLSLVFFNESNRKVLANDTSVISDRIEVPTLTNRFKEISYFIAGINLNEKSELYPLTKNIDYINYKSSVGAYN